MAPSAIEVEEQQFQAGVAAVKRWWTEPRWRYTRRPFTAEQIVSKRGSVSSTFLGNQMSMKLWNILEGRFKVRLSRLTCQRGISRLGNSITWAMRSRRAWQHCD